MRRAAAYEEAAAIAAAISQVKPDDNPAVAILEAPFRRCCDARLAGWLASVALLPSPPPCRFGPTIRARAGDRLSVRLRNELVQPEHLAGYAHSGEENGFHGGHGNRET